MDLWFIPHKTFHTQEILAGHCSRGRLCCWGSSSSSSSSSEKLKKLKCWTPQGVLTTVDGTVSSPPLENHLPKSKVWGPRISVISPKTTHVNLEPEMQRSISSFETLAQIALLFVTARFFPSHRVPICLKSLSDSGAESGSNKLWNMTYPLSIFLERMCLLSAMLGIEIDVSHIPGS